MHISPPCLPESEKLVVSSKKRHMRQSLSCGFLFCGFGPKKCGGGSDGGETDHHKLSERKGAKGRKKERPSFSRLEAVLSSLSFSASLSLPKKKYVIASFPSLSLAI